MISEPVFLVDDEDRPLQPTLRRDAIAKGFWRRTGGGIAFDAERDLVLCHQRSNTKDERPNVWVATYGGKSLPLEESEATAKRELKEEFGIQHDAVRMIFYRKHKSLERRQFEYLYFTFIDSVRLSVNIDPDEIAQHAWLARAQVEEFLRGNKNWYGYGYEIEMLEKVKAV